MNLETFLATSLPQFWIYVIIAVPAMAATIFAAWFFSAVVPSLVSLLQFRRYRFGQYQKDVEFRRKWLTRKNYRRVSRFVRMVKRTPSHIVAWFAAWIPGPPRGMYEIDSVPLQNMENGILGSEEMEERGIWY